MKNNKYSHLLIGARAIYTTNGSRTFVSINPLTEEDFQRGEAEFKELGGNHRTFLLLDDTTIKIDKREL